MNLTIGPSCKLIFRHPRLWTRDRCAGTPGAFVSFKLQAWVEASILYPMTQGLSYDSSLSPGATSRVQKMRQKIAERYRVKNDTQKRIEKFHLSLGNDDLGALKF